jgi:hypothetical protein
MSKKTFEHRSYFFWKWADNDLSGQPHEVHADLLHGKLHPALQRFDARPLLRTLDKAARFGRSLNQEWTWEVHPKGEPGSANFVFVTCPIFVKQPSPARRRAVKQFFPLELSGCDAETGELIDFMLPKKNAFHSGQHPEGDLFDIGPIDLRELLKSIRADEPNSYAILVNSNNHFVQCLKEGHRFVVEWRENHSFRDLMQFDHWRATYPPSSKAVRKFVPPGRGYTVNSKDSEEYRETMPDEFDLLLYKDTLAVFEAFLRGEAQPEQYLWRNINAELP